jgi:hypothetical protein
MAASLVGSYQSLTFGFAIKWDGQNRNGRSLAAYRVFPAALDQMRVTRVLPLLLAANYHSALTVRARCI